MQKDLSPSVDLSEFDKQIAAFADEKFAKGEPCFISALGIALGDQLRQMRAATGLGLGEYVREKLSDVYDLIEVKPNTVALWPKGRPQTEAFQVAASRPSRASTTPTRRFLPWFWQAFAVPNAGRSRFYDPVSHTVSEAPDEASKEAVEIPASFIRSDESPFNVKEIQGRIIEWLSENKLDANRFREPAGAAIEREHAVSLLDALIAALDKKQLQSFSLPMDVIATLAARKA
jgi:hypothetical protein